MKCFYHSADLDGHCSGAIVRMKYSDCEFIGINYGDDFPWDTIEPGEDVYMVDFCLEPFCDMVKLDDMCMLHWIDHHKTSLRAAEDAGFLASGGQLLEIGRAGCELTWEYIFGDIAVPDAVMLLGRYDVWDHANSFVLPFQYGMRMEKDTRPENYEFWWPLLSSIVDKETMQYIERGKLILAYEASQNEKFSRAYSFVTEICGMPVICANRGFCNSKTFDSVYDPEQHDMMVLFCRTPRKEWRVSLYTDKENVDCGVVATKFGGGGHKNAAGFLCKKLPFDV